MTWTNERQYLEDNADGTRKRSTCSSYELLFAEWERGAKAAGQNRLTDGSQSGGERQWPRAETDRDGPSMTETGLQTSDHDIYGYFYEQFFEMQSMRDGLQALDTKIQIGFGLALVIILYFFGYYHPRRVERMMVDNLQRVLQQQLVQLRVQQVPENSENSHSRPQSTANSSNPPSVSASHVSNSSMLRSKSEEDSSKGALCLQKQVLGKIELCVASEFLLGYGSNGTAVYKGCFEGRAAAVKRTVKTHDTVEDNRELDMLRTVQHPNLVRYLCMEEDGNFRYLALELCECTLDRYLLSDSFACASQVLQKLPDLEICEQILCGLSYLHSLEIVHR